MNSAAWFLAALCVSIGVALGTLVGALLQALRELQCAQKTIKELERQVSVPWHCKVTLRDLQREVAARLADASHSDHREAGL